MWISFQSIPLSRISSACSFSSNSAKKFPFPRSLGRSALPSCVLSQGLPLETVQAPCMVISV